METGVRGGYIVFDEKYRIIQSKYHRFKVLIPFEKLKRLPEDIDVPKPVREEKSKRHSEKIRDRVESVLIKKKDEDRIIEAIQKGDRALREKFLKRKEGMVKRLAAGIFRGHFHKSTTLEDLVQVGMIALNGAIDRYEIQDNLFDSYASKRIYGGIVDYLREELRTLSMGAWSRNVPTIRAAYDKIVQRNHGKRPSIKELTKEAGVTETSVTNFFLLEYAHRIDDGSDWTLEERAAAHAAIEHSREITYEEIFSCMEDALEESWLTERERSVLEHSFWLNETFPKPLREIGEALGVTESRISQVRKSAIGKIRHFIHDRHWTGKSLGEAKMQRGNSRV